MPAAGLMPVQEVRGGQALGLELGLPLQETQKSKPRTRTGLGTWQGWQGQAGGTALHTCGPPAAGLSHPAWGGCGVRPSVLLVPTAALLTQTCLVKTPGDLCAQPSLKHPLAGHHEPKGQVLRTEQRCQRTQKGKPRPASGIEQFPV